MVFLKLFLRLPVVLSSSPLKILEVFCCGIHSNRIHVIRNDFICFIEEGLFCLYDGRKTDRIWSYVFQRGQSSMVAIGPGRVCLLKIYIYEKTTFWHKMIWHKIGPSKTFHRVILQDMAFRMIPNIAWFTPHILAWWELETVVLLRRGQFSWE